MNSVSKYRYWKEVVNYRNLVVSLAVVLGLLATFSQFGVTRPSTSVSTGEGVFDKFLFEVASNLTSIDQRPDPYFPYRIFHDFVMFETHGVKNSSIRDFLDNRSDFLNIKDVTLAMVVPYEGDNEWQDYGPFFGVRNFLYPGIDRFNLISMNHPHPNCHRSKCLMSMMSLAGGFATSQALLRQDISERTVEFPKYFDYPIRGLSAPFGHTYGDIDGDNRNDFISGRHLYLSATNDFVTLEVTNPAFIELNGTVLLVGSSDQSTLSVYRFNPASQNLVNHMNFKLQEFEISNKAAYGVNPYPVSKVNGCTKMLLVGEKELLNVRLCDKNLDEISRISYPDQLVRGSIRDFRIGAWGDFSGDGYNDFVISARRADNDSGAAWIVDGRSIQSVGRMTLSKAALLKVSNVDGYFKTGQTKENDGIGSSLSYIAGDLDGDGIVDLSIGAHFNMAYSGSLFVISGADIRNIGSKQAKPEETAEISTRDKWVTRIVGVLGSELAPPYYHFDNFDINDDGYDDIVISADNDGFSGPNSGSIYILSLNNSMTK